MASNKKGPPVYRIGNTGLRKPTVQRIAAQEQIRTTAPSSSVYAQVKSALDTWNTSTDAMASLSTQVQAAVQQLAQLRTRLSQAEAQFEIDERGYRGVVQLASQGKPELIESLGFTATTGTTPAGSTVATPTDLVGTPGVDPGAVHLKWQAPKGAHMYAVQMSVDPVTATSWQSLPGTSRRSLKIGDLISGARYWFRVAMVGAGTQSGWSQAESVTAR
jgi:hypothetical protein